MAELKGVLNSSQLSNVQLNDKLSLKTAEINDLMVSKAILNEKCKMLETSELELKRIINNIPQQILEINANLFTELKSYKDILSSETVKLSNSLRSPNARGMWG